MGLGARAPWCRLEVRWPVDVNRTGWRIEQRGERLIERPIDALGRQPAAPFGDGPEERPMVELLMLECAVCGRGVTVGEHEERHTIEVLATHCA